MRARVGPVVALAFGQLRHQRARWALLAAGVALIVAVPVVTAGLAHEVGAQAVRGAIAQLSPAARTLLVSQEASSTFRLGTPAQDDRIVRGQLARLSATPALRELLYRELTARGQSFLVAAVDGLPGAVRLTSGRLPRTCTPQRCEVVQLGGSRSALPPAAAGLGIVVVGTATRANPLLVSGQLDATNLPVLLGASPDDLARLSSLALFASYYAWVTLLDADRVVALGAHDYVDVGADVDATLDAKVGATSFQRPDDVVQTAGDRAAVSTRRFGLLGGFAAVLLLGFAVVAGVGLRRESGLLVGLLRRRGATPAQVGTLVAVEALTCCALGAAAGAVLGGIAAALERTGTGLTALTAAGHALATAALPAILLVLASVGVVVAVLLWPEAQARGLWRTLDLIAVAALGAALLAGARGTASASALASGNDPIVVALPVLASVVAGLVAARLWAPVTRLAAALLPRRALAARLALLGSLRRPLRAVATAGFLTAAVASVVFAGAYRATLLRNDVDQAAFRVPLDYRLTGGGGLAVSSLDGAALQHATGAAAYAVQRTTATVVDPTGVTTSLAVLAPDHAAIARMHDFGRTTGASIGAGTAAQRLLPTAHVSAPVLPAGARSIRIAAGGINPQSVVTLFVRGAVGASAGITLDAAGTTALVGTVPAGGPWTVTAVGVEESYNYASHHAHATGEGNTDQPALSGTLTLGAVQVDGRARSWDWSGWGSARGTAKPTAARLVLGYKIMGAPVVAVPDYAVLSGAEIPVIVDPATAQDARDGVLAFSLDDTTPLTGRIVAVMPRLPTVQGPFVLADRSSLTTVLDAARPGRAPDEYWLAGGTATTSRTLAAAPYGRLTVESRTSVQHSLDDDPVSRGSRTLLVLVALLALAVAAVALVLLVIGERRDGAGELYAWESDGLSPALLRRLLMARSLAVAVVAVPIGILAGLVVARIGVTLVSVDASGTTPTPPLIATLGSVWTVVALVAGIGAGVVVGGVVAVRSLREHFPVAAEVDLR